MPPKSASKRKVKSKTVVESDIEDYKPHKVLSAKSSQKSLAKEVVNSDADVDADIPNIDEPTARFVLGFLHVTIILMSVYLF
jgi:hypothetical protein